MKKGTGLAFGAVIGAAIGVVAGILTAPKSGKETRQDIKHRGEQLKDDASRKRDNLLFKAEEIGDEVRSKVTDVIDSAINQKSKK